MRNVHRIITTAFSPRASSRTPGQAPTAHTAVDARPYGTSGRLTCSPWEGLYLELDN